MTGTLENAVLIAGPTASGKSSLALDVARRAGGTVVNADSMQVYNVLSVLTARPGARDMAKAPHRLYGHVHPADPYSTGRWLRDVAALAREGEAGSPFVFVGGTGLYFRALTEGLSPMPEVPAAVRAHWRGRLAREGPETLHRLLAGRDPDAGGAIDPADGQRIVRALEVLDVSGRPIGDWQAMRSTPLVETAAARMVVLEPDRTLLNERIDARFEGMVAAGALDEVSALLALRLDPSTPAMKAIGVRELAPVVTGEASLADALTAAKTATRRYAKRQATWFRHQLGGQWTRMAPSPSNPGWEGIAEALARPARG